MAKVSEMRNAWKAIGKRFFDSLCDLFDDKVKKNGLYVNNRAKFVNWKELSNFLISHLQQQNTGHSYYKLSWNKLKKLIQIIFYYVQAYDNLSKIVTQEFIIVPHHLRR